MQKESVWSLPWERKDRRRIMHPKLWYKNSFHNEMLLLFVFNVVVLENLVVNKQCITHSFFFKASSLS